MFSINGVLSKLFLMVIILAGIFNSVVSNMDGLISCIFYLVGFNVFVGVFDV